MPPEVLLALTAVVTAVTVGVFLVGRGLLAAMQDTDVRLRRVNGRLRTAEHVASSQKVVEDIQGAAGATAETITKVVRGVMRGISARRSGPQSPPET